MVEIEHKETGKFQPLCRGKKLPDRQASFTLEMAGKKSGLGLNSKPVAERVKCQ